MSFKVCDYQHQHVYLNYFLNLTIGITEIPTDFHAGWYKVTKGGPDSLQAPWIGTSFASCIVLERPSKVYSHFCGQIQHNIAGLLSMFPVKVLQPFFSLCSV